MNEAQPASSERISRRSFVLWGFALGLLLAFGVLWWAHVAPFVAVRGAIARYHGEGTTNTVQELGGPRSAQRKLVYYLHLPRRLATDRPTAVQFLGECGAEAGPALVECLRDEDSWVRGAAAWALGEMKYSPAYGPLVDALDDQHANVQRAAAKSLGELGDRRAVEMLLVKLDDSDTILGNTACFALAQIGDQRAFERIVKRLEHADPLVRLMAIVSLGELGNREAVEPLKRFLAKNGLTVLATEAQKVIDKLQGSAP